MFLAIHTRLACALVIALLSSLPVLAITAQPFVVLNDSNRLAGNRASLPSLHEKVCQHHIANGHESLPSCPHPFATTVVTVEATTTTTTTTYATEYTTTTTYEYVTVTVMASPTPTKFRGVSDHQQEEQHVFAIPTRIQTQGVNHEIRVERGEF